MATIQEIWLPAHITADDLWHAAAHSAAQCTTPECSTVMQFVHDRGFHAAHEPMTVLNDTNLTVCAYHHGSQYRVYAIGAPEQVLEHSLLSENEREKALLESRRMDRHTGVECRLISVATGTCDTVPKNTRSLTGLTYYGHVAIAGPF